MSEDVLERIQQRAYAIWESEGRPDGAAETHWQRASVEILDASPAPAKPARKPRAVKDTVKAESKPRAPRAEGKPRRKTAVAKDVVAPAE